MFSRHLTICVGAFVAVALPQAAGAADPAPTVTPLMERAFVLHEQGPDRLRHFIHRTRMIYALRQEDVVKSYEAARVSKTASTEEQPRVASAAPDVR